MTTSDSIPLKRCTKCGVEKPATLEYFYKHPKGKYGLGPTCKTCHSASALLAGQKNPERKRELHRQWAKRNPEKTREYNRRRRARKRSLPIDFTIEHERFALNYFNGRCAVCNRPLRDLFGTHIATMDHWIPLSKGGSTTPENMVPLCGGLGGCNNSKHNNDPIEWVHSQFSARKAAGILARIQAYFDTVKG